MTRASVIDTVEVARDVDPVSPGMDSSDCWGVGGVILTRGTTGLEMFRSPLPEAVVINSAGDESTLASSTWTRRKISKSINFSK